MEEDLMIGNDGYKFYMEGPVIGEGCFG